uniref:Xylulose kinase-1 n=1 Tax=Tanacetum cinerariifolium TaxID=118510 RepID=A0A6L2JY66_TANCI|nr:hypothetical protein [Tanacetum cinerariifolium]
MVVFLSKPTESDGFEQIVDFSNAHPIRYALTVNPTIYISCIEQFWSTAMAKTINGEAQLHARVDGKKIIITEASIRRDIQLADEEGVDYLPNSTIFEQLALMGTTAWNEFSSIVASAIICLATNQKFIFSNWSFDSMIRNLDNAFRKFFMYPRVGKVFSGRVRTLFPTMVVQSELGEDEAIHKELGDSLVRATASRLGAEQYNGNIAKTQSKATPNESSSRRTNSGSGLRCQETVRDTTAQTRFESVSKHSNDLLLVRGGEDLFAAAGQNENVVNITTKEFTLAQALKALKTSKPKVKRLVIEEPDESTRTTTISSQQSQIYMLVEKKYPITPPILLMMLEKKLQIYYESEMAYQLCKLIKRHLKK